MQKGVTKFVGASEAFFPGLHVLVDMNYPKAIRGTIISSDCSQRFVKYDDVFGLCDDKGIIRTEPAYEIFGKLFDSFPQYIHPFLPDATVCISSE